MKHINILGEEMKYITVLDFEVGKVFQYEVGKDNWNPDYESCEAFLYGAGHNPANIEWMVTSNDKIIKR